jgi:hypothetical protein
MHQRARTDRSGGREVTRVPTAIRVMAASQLSSVARPPVTCYLPAHDASIPRSVRPAFILRWLIADR